MLREFLSVVFYVMDKVLSGKLTYMQTVFFSLGVYFSELIAIQPFSILSAGANLLLSCKLTFLFGHKTGFSPF